MTTQTHAGGTTQRRAALVGTGLIGGSVGLALRSLGWHVTGTDEDATVLARAVEVGAVDATGVDPDAELTVVATPVSTVAQLARQALQRGGVVTDVGSTKGWIGRQMAGLLPAGVFVGSHPVAGSEKQGLQSASADLYENALTVVAGSADAPEAAVARVTDLWASTGSRTCRMAPEDHDRLLARTSHLPHVAAAALAKAIGRDSAAQVGAFCGTGFYDSTRVASGSIEMWNDVLRTNAPAVAEELRAFKLEVERVYDDLQAGRFDDVAASAPGWDDGTVAGRAYVLRHGRIELEGSAAQLIDDPAFDRAYFGFDVSSESEPA